MTSGRSSMLGAGLHWLQDLVRQRLEAEIASDADVLGDAESTSPKASRACRAALVSTDERRPGRLDVLLRANDVETGAGAEARLALCELETLEGLA